MPQRILLVDDESAVLFAYKKVLQRPQVTVDAVESKEETLRLLGKRSYAAAILDLRLGGGTCEEGLELICRIKEKSPGTKIIMITAYGSPEIKEKAFKLGADFYFEKPVSTSVIQDALKNSGVAVI